ncbi:PDR/VanB family oxidoreductase [Amycolatopsis endophytica]|uniref:Ferredoxin-NADP reductase n=1 Tax=Amycolatopsis endophytica TaxID=860233 RepID=A0A853B1W9_9PSEU|nr:PDR/VanB family oxidoreductase [Amycolatopsis endophytica]NYI88824.1 ferredoxin-NADP reductase [Amycolatopsis endophytica]
MARKLVVAAKERLADGVVELRLRDPAGGELAQWSAGAHVDVHCGPGMVRQYSLCGDPARRGEYRIAVLREPESRGGSRALHDDVGEGALIEVSEPRNHFGLERAGGYLFVAGGIGITPILPMLAEAQRAGKRWRLLYGGRSRASMAFLDELRGYGEKVRLAPQDECGLLDLPSALAGLPEGTLVYCCGPEPLLAAIEAACAGAGVPTALRVERFSAKPRQHVVDGEFEVELAGTGQRLRVPSDRTLLDVLRDAEVDVLTSCEEGTCGSCETGVLRGEPDHRDSVLTDEEREQGDRIMVCVSRSRTPLLTLDL